ncbi:hypothetical protein B566_EDAN011470 [Ephemera danica]|nr:hypothetical protein B566_EDAN011470 [Ephemera danica]
MQTRFVCIILIIILPLTTSLILKIGRNRINTPERLRITRQRQYVIQCCAGHWSCNAAGSSGRLRTVTAPNALKTTNEQIIAEDTTIEDETITDISSPINSNNSNNSEIIDERCDNCSNQYIGKCNFNYFFNVGSFVDDHELYFNFTDDWYATWLIS